MDTHRPRNPESLPADKLGHIPVLSVCVLTYQARDLLRDCLHSLYENTSLEFEAIVVDNGSTDNTQQMLQEQFPTVHYIANTDNTGFTRPMNQALQMGGGQYLLQLNNDTLILPQALDRLVAFAEAHPRVGICGPKVLNRDLTLQKPCRRGDARPWAVITYFIRLYKLFPKSKLFGQYLLNYLDEDDISPVDGVSGSCMLIRRQVVDQIGYLDERFFAYQEDSDYCLRARQAGWQIYYMPDARIIHYGGMGGSRVQPYRSIFEWHRSYFRYYRKHFARDYFFLLNWFFYLLMLLKLVLSLTANLLRSGARSIRKFAAPRSGSRSSGPSSPT